IEIDSGRLRRPDVEAIEHIDERDELATRGRRGEHPQQEGRAPPGSRGAPLGGRCPQGRTTPAAAPSSACDRAFWPEAAIRGRRARVQALFDSWVSLFLRHSKQHYNAPVPSDQGVSSGLRYRTRPF